MSRSGKLIATNDVFVNEMINDKDYIINSDSTILTLIQETGRRSVSGNWRELAHNDTRTGYIVVRYKRKKLSLHRIMYAKFVGKLEADLTINHKNGNPKDNSPSNLELVTQADNALHSFRVLNRKHVKGNTVIDLAIANTIREEHKTGIPYSKLSLKYGLSKGHISEIINNKIWVG